MKDMALLKNQSDQSLPDSDWSPDWRNVLWREWRNSEDEEYAQRLFKLVTDDLPSPGEHPLRYQHPHWHPSWREQPLRAEVEKALWEARAAHDWVRTVWTGPLRRLEKRLQGTEAPGSLTEDLQSNDWVDRFTARHTLITLGGKAVPALQALIEHPPDTSDRLAISVLKSIGFETTALWEEEAPTLLCPECLARCQAHRAHLPLQLDVTYYGCRICHQSREFIHCPHGVTAVLDSTWTETHDGQNGLLRINWLAYRKLFDFDRVEIVQANDEDVERFAVQVGNDTDPFREPRYKQMPCIVKPGCELSKNTLRVLDSMFGPLER